MTQVRTLASVSLRPGDLSGLKVLVADDHATTARLISDLLRAAGVGHVEIAIDGLRAREMLRAWDPHILFTDWNMPMMDGLELTRSIRRAAVAKDPMIPNPQIPVIMLTAMRSAREVENARRAGVNEFVIKPFTPASVLSRVQLVLSKPRPFIISDKYVGPDRRRRAEISYSGPMRRAVDPEEVMDAVERQSTRETMGVELAALRRIIKVRGSMDRATLQMTYRVMQHTRFRARQVRDEMVAQISQLLIDYADAMGGPERCDPAVLEIHFDAMATLLAAPETDEVLAKRVLHELDAAVQKRIARGYKAA
ncbi:MAG: response regulator [Alphaproteobacteria bacterium]|nr:response regulator [Alphaproteobacteria bacterium]